MNKIGIKDIHGNEILEGDKVELFYVDPYGKQHQDIVIAKATVVYRHVCYMLDVFESEVGYIENLTVFSLLRRKKGEYVENFGNKTIIEDVGLFQKIME